MTAIAPGGLFWGQHDLVGPGDRRSPNGRHLGPRVGDAHPTVDAFYGFLVITWPAGVITYQRPP